MAVRSNNTEWTRAWKTYVQAINPIIARNQITVGGPVILSQIENEYRGEGSRYVGDVQYMGQLEAEFRETGIAVPIFHNVSFILA